MKFGGTSLEDVAGFERVAHLLRSEVASQPVAVVSAMSGVTDALMTSLRVARQKGVLKAARSLEVHFERHLRIANALGPSPASRMSSIIVRARNDITTLLASGDSGGVSMNVRDAAKQDAISSYGEMLSAQLLALVLDELGSPASYVDARRCIRTDDVYTMANPLIQETTLHTQAELRPLLDQKRLPVLGGFIGSTLAGATTTMGRGSSNHTATLISSALSAREVQIWTDVNGVHTADPFLVKPARTIPYLSYDEAEEIARLGAKVLHQGMFEPVRSQQIPVRIRNSRLSGAEGTLIAAQSPGRSMAPGKGIKAIAHRNHLLKLDVRSSPDLVVNGFQRSIEAILRKHCVPLQIVGRTADGLSLACDEDTPVSAVVEDLERCGAVQISSRQAIVGCVGERLRDQPKGEDGMVRILKSFDPTLEWQQISSINLLTMVDASHVGALVKSLHQEIFERRS